VHSKTDENESTGVKLVKHPRIVEERMVVQKRRSCVVYCDFQQASDENVERG
jgi:hypothetical protein